MDDLVLVEAEPEDGRLSREQLAGWRREVVTHASVLVAGAGALGNEVIKNLALLGIGRLIVADFDTVAISNLSRSVLFREADAGQPKARRGRGTRPGDQSRARA